MKETELKPCPFCGGKADFIGETSTIKCKHCGGAFIVTNPLISRIEAAEAWGTRVRNDEHTGEWIEYKKGMWYCSNCKAVGDHGTYCHHCGARMKGEQK